MTSSEQQPSLPHSEGLSLAWYAAGKLSDSEQRRVAAHLETCAECRAELQSVTQVHSEFRQALKSEPRPSPRARATVMARINAAHANKPVAGFFAPLVDWLRVPAVPRWAPAAALLLAVIPIGLLLRQTPEPLATLPEITTRGLPTAPTRLNVRFNPQATDLQIRELLGVLGARIVDGPGATAEYLIELAAADPATTAERIKAARAHPEILQTLELAAP